MTGSIGLRARKKAQTRQHIANIAAGLFAQRDYDAVAMIEVARAADVSEQTVYNYFPAKQDLVLDQADQIRSWYDEAVRGCARSASPARALEPLVMADIDRYRGCDLDEARGQFLAQSVASATLRRFTLEERERQTLTVAEAIVATTPGVLPLMAHAYAAALIAVIQAVHDRIGTSVLNRSEQQPTADGLQATAREAFGQLARAFATVALDPIAAAGEPTP